MDQIGRWYFLGIVHPPPSKELKSQLPPGWMHTPAELAEIASTLPGASVQVEHAGVYEAIDSNLGTRGELPSREIVTATLADRALDDPTKSPVGQVVDAFVGPSGALYAMFSIYQGLHWVAWLVTQGFIPGISLTSIRHTSGIATYEISLTNDPARAASYIVHHSEDPDKVRTYMGKMISGSIQDPARNFRRPLRIMAANKDAAAAAAAMEVETPDKPSSAAASLMAAIGSHPDEAQRKLIMDSINTLSNSTTAAKALAEQSAADLAKARADVEKAKRAGEVNSALMKSQLDAYKSQIPEGVPFDDKAVEAAFQPGATLADAQAGLGAVMVSASHAAMLRSAGRKREAAVHDLKEEEASEPDSRIADLDKLLMANKGSAAAAAAATPRTAREIADEKLRLALNTAGF